MLRKEDKTLRRHSNTINTYLSSQYKKRYPDQNDSDQDDSDKEMEEIITPTAPASNVTSPIGANPIGHIIRTPSSGEESASSSCDDVNATLTTPLHRQPAKNFLLTWSSLGFFMFIWWLFKEAIKLVTAVVVAAPTAFNALVTLTNTATKDISLDWFKSLTPPIQAGSTALFVSSAYTNTKLNMSFFRRTFLGLIKNGKQICRNPWFIIPSFLSIGFGIGGGFAAGTIAYDAFEWAGSIAMITLALINFVAFFTSRYFGMNKMVEYIVDRDVIHAQIAITEKLNQATSDCVDKLDDYLRSELTESSSELTETQLNELFFKLAQKASELQHSHYFTQKNNYFRNTGIAFDVLLATVVAGFALITFAQKAAVGVNKFSEKISNEDLSELNNLYQIAYGLIGGIPSALLYGMSGFAFRQRFVDAVYYVYKHPSTKNIAHFIFEFLSLIGSCAGMYYLGRGIPGKNLFGIPANNPLPIVSAIGNAAGGLVVNGTTLEDFRCKELSVITPTADLLDCFRSPTTQSLNPEIARKKLKKMSSDTVRFFGLPTVAANATHANDIEVGSINGEKEMDELKRNGNRRNHY